MGLAKILPVSRNVIRRYHGTNRKYINDIANKGLLVNPPEAERAMNVPDYPGVYTTVKPTYNYFMPDEYSNALVVLDIPKDWYRQAKRLPYNPEMPVPPKKPEHWSNVYNDDWRVDEAIDNYRTIIPIQQGGRVDIFKQDIPKEFINEIIVPRGDNTYKTIIKPNRNIDWWNFDFFDDL